MKNINLILLALTPLALNATEETNPTQTYAPREYSIIPPSPEVSSLINFYDVPVDYFHGLPDINR